MTICVGSHFSILEPSALINFISNIDLLNFLNFDLYFYWNPNDVVEIGTHAPPSGRKVSMREEK